jgi:hypothetical protein
VSQVAPLEFFRNLVWLDGRPLLDTIEPYRRKMFDEALYSFDPDGRPRYDRVLRGVSKKNWKSSDLALAGLYRFLAWETAAGNDAYILANDEDQSADDLDLIKKIVEINPILDREVKVYSKEIARRDGRGVLKILPAQDALGAHGKTFIFCGFDEIHGYKNYDLFEALSPDPTRRDVLTWITSYAGIRHAPGIPLYDFLQIAKAGTDPRMYFSWHAADFTTDPALAGEHVTPEQRANPSMASWDQPDYLEQQRLRLPTSRFRRLHLNLPGSPEGAAFSAEHVMAAIVTGRRRLPYSPGTKYIGAVDMSGGSSDDSTFAIAHKDRESGKAVLDLLVAQSGRPPFNPRTAVSKFAALAHEYGISFVTGDNYGGQTYRFDFQGHGISYDTFKMPRALGVKANTTPAIPRQERTGGQPSASDFYEAFEPRLNAGEVELLDISELQEQLLTLVWRGGKIDHEPGGHDDWANAAAVALVLAVPARPSLHVSPELRARIQGGPSSTLAATTQPPQNPAPRGRLYISPELLARAHARAPRSCPGLWPGPIPANWFLHR